MVDLSTAVLSIFSVSRSIKDIETLRKFVLTSLNQRPEITLFAIHDAQSSTPPTCGDDKSKNCFFQPVIYQEEHLGYVSACYNQYDPNNETLTLLIARLVATEIASRRFEVELTNMVEKRTRDLDSMLEDATNRATRKNSLLANLSHELRTPINAVLGFAELIKLRAVGDNPNLYFDYIDHIYAGAIGLRNTITRILQYTETVFQLEEVQTEVVNINTSIADAVEIVEGRFGALGRIKHDQSIEHIFTLASEDLLRQALIELLDNAVRYGGEDTITVSSQLDPSARRVQINITDFGPGFQVDDEEDPFVPFGKGYTKDHSKSGVGMGIPIANEIIKNIGGNIIFKKKVEKFQAIVTLKLV